MEEDATQSLYHIGGVAELAAVHPQTLRLYERHGLLKPSRSRGKTRLYSDRDVERVKLIVHLTRNEGINLAGVAKILELEESIREVETLLRRWMQEWQARVERDMELAGAETAASGSSKRGITVPIRRG